MIVWYTSRRASQQGRSVGPPRPAVGGSVGSGAGRSVGSARPGEEARLTPQSGRSVGLFQSLNFWCVGGQIPTTQFAKAHHTHTRRSFDVPRTNCRRAHCVPAQKSTFGAIAGVAPSMLSAYLLARPLGAGRRRLRAGSVGRRGPTSPTRPQPPSTRVGRSARPGSEPGARGRAGRSVGDVYQTINFEPPNTRLLGIVTS